MSYTVAACAVDLDMLGRMIGSGDQELAEHLLERLSGELGDIARGRVTTQANRFPHDRHWRT